MVLFRNSAVSLEIDFSHADRVDGVSLAMRLRLLPVQLALLATEAVAYFATLGMDVVGIDNGMRGEFFGQEASTNKVHSRNHVD